MPRIWGLKSLTSLTPLEAQSEQLDITATPTDVLRCFRGRERLVALIGAWSFGEALIAFEPDRVLDSIGDIDRPMVPGPGFGGGWIGSFGYQFGREFEDLGTQPTRPIAQPDIRFGFYSLALRYTDGLWFLDNLGDPDPTRRRDILSALSALKRANDSQPYSLTPFSMRPDPAMHQAGIRTILDHIEAGDIFQANLTTRVEATFEGDPLDVFCRGVEELAPRYAAFVSAPDGALASFSPELFLRRSGNTIVTSPIKGTAPLDTDPAVLESSAKNRAENIMIVDLMRNDLGRICQAGSVRVPVLNRIEKHTVWHLVSDVTGSLLPGTSDADVIRATFPPGSVTGAPKIRAMQLINELEPTAREAYTGAIGYVSSTLGMELNVAIRTFEFARDNAGRQHIWLGVGGGIVADSDPYEELVECLNKAQPLIRAIGGELPIHLESAAESDSLVHPITRAPHANPKQGIFETLLVTDGRVENLGGHLARLDTSSRALYQQSVAAGVADRVHQAIGSLKGAHRLNITVVPEADKITTTISTSPVEIATEEWALVPRILPGGYGEHKWVDRALLASASELEPLLIDEDGSLLETARANIFLVMDDGLHTPALDGRILPGTMRGRVIEHARSLGIPVFQHRLTSADLAKAHEVFVTNALRGIVPVTSCQGIGSWPAGPVHAQLKNSSAPESGATYAKPGATPHVLFIDNYDSFVFNLVQYTGELGARTRVIRNDALAVTDIEKLIDAEQITHLIISPGPGTPADAGVTEDLIRVVAGKIPILGVCLGHQAIVEVFGGTVARGERPVHGKASLVHHDQSDLFAGLASPIVCGRYHSLVATDLGPTLNATAHTADGTVMAIEHPGFRVYGVQFHPESILTSRGHDMIENFLRFTTPAR